MADVALRFSEEGPQTVEKGKRVGRITTITDSGEIYVDYSGNDRGPRRALVSLSVPERSLLALRKRSLQDIVAVLLVEDGLPEPVIVDLAIDAAKLKDPKDSLLSPMESELHLQAGEQITISCGKSSIQLRKDGKIIIRGEKVTSRASGENKIRGGSISLN